MLAHLLLLAASLQTTGLVYETPLLRLELAETGQLRSLKLKADGSELLADAKTPFAYAQVGGQWVAASRVARSGDRLEVGFGSSGVAVTYTAKAGGAGVSFRLAKVQGDPEAVRIVQAKFVRQPRYGYMIGVRSGDVFTAATMPITEAVRPEMVSDGSTAAVAYRRLGIEGRGAAIVAAPTPGFMAAVRRLELDENIPSGRSGGEWVKTSKDLRDGYLFVDMTEANVDAAIRMAKLAGLNTILVPVTVWSGSVGSNTFHPKNYPNGEAGLRAVVAKCRAAGIKVGLHLLASLVARNDGLVRPTPDPRLLDDGEGQLAFGLARSETSVTLRGFRGLFEPSKPEVAAGQRLQIGDELLEVKSADGDRLEVSRGAFGTAAADHSAGDRVRRLATHNGYFIVDLRTNLKDEVAGRLAGIANLAGIEMLYFDGGEAPGVMGDVWHWSGLIQSAVAARLDHDVLIQGSAITAYTWHLFARMTTDDFATVGTKEYLDFHKIPMLLNTRNNLLASEFGWWGLLGPTPDHGPTRMDEVDHLGARMLAYDTPVSVQTTMAEARENAQTDALLTRLGQYARLLDAGSVPASVRDRLRQGDWKLTGGKLVPVSEQGADLDGARAARFDNPFDDQPLRFRLERLPSPGTGSAVGLVDGADLAGKAGAKRGELARSVRFAARDLSDNRVIRLRAKLSGNAPARLTVQLQSSTAMLRDFVFDLQPGTNDAFLARPSADLILSELKPDVQVYSAKHAVRPFDWTRVVAVHLRWAEPPSGGTRLTEVEVSAMPESDQAVPPAFQWNGQKVQLPFSLRTGESAELLDAGLVRLGPGGAVLERAAGFRAPSFAAGKNAASAASNGAYRLTVFAENPAGALQP